MCLDTHSLPGLLCHVLPLLHHLHPEGHFIALHAKETGDHGFLHISRIVERENYIVGS